MRVQDSNQIGLTSSMGRKKQRLRKAERQNSETSDEGTNDVQCSHINKSVNINQVRKALKHSTVLGRCQLCNASNDHSHKKPGKNDSVALASGDSSLPSDELPPDYEPSVFFCLQCGHQGCDRYTPDKHALQHFETTSHAVAHNIVLDMMSFQVWCYACDNFIAADASKKLLECADFVYHNAGHRDSITSFVKRTEPIKENGFTQESLSAESPVEGDTIANDGINQPKVAQLTQATSGVLLGFPKIKGLNNLGNTCFFNAVVQNLGQTHLLESLLRDSCRKGYSIDLSICHQESDSKPCSDDELMNEKDHEPGQDLQKLDSLSLNLGECGALTQSVINLFDEMKTSSKQNSVSPSALFGQVCKKAPRFKGFQQQDSHELLRYLLDAIKGEETKRSRAAILKAFKLSEKPSPKEIPDELHSKIKAFGLQAKHTFIDSIFGGYFISTVVCQACDTHHQILEPFLDVSLPVIEEKSFKSSGFHGGKLKDDGKEMSKDAEASPGAVKQSKHMSKKERRLAKKSASKSKKPSGKKEKQPDGKDVEESGLLNSSTNATEEARKEETVEKDYSEHDNMKKTNSGEVDGEEVDQDVKGDKVECSDSMNASADGCQQTVEATNGELRNSSLESESSDADVEDNEESDASRYRGMVSSVDTLPAADCKEEEHKNTIVNGFGDEDQKSERSGDTVVDQSDKDVTAVPHSAEGVQDVDVISNGVKELEIRNDSIREDKDPSANLLSCAVTSDDRCSREAVYSSARKAAMKTLAPREKPLSQECSVLASLYQFTSLELLSGNNMYRCSVCNKTDSDGKAVQGSKPVLTCASTQFLIFSPPAVLTLHLKRFQQVGFNLRKITRHIEFSELLDLAPFCSALCQNIQPGQRRVLYSLYGIVEHSGTLRSGHYTAYVKVRHSNPSSKTFLQTLVAGQPSVQHLVDAMRAMGERDAATVDGANAKHVAPPLGKWYYISDSSVSEVKNISNVLNCQAYLLFYERIE